MISLIEQKSSAPGLSNGIQFSALKKTIEIESLPGLFSRFSGTKSCDIPWNGSDPPVTIPYDLMHFEIKILKNWPETALRNSLQ